MPIIRINNAELYYQDFNDPKNDKECELNKEGELKETIVFAHGLLWDNEMFAPQIELLKSKYRCIAFDFRGQGKSESTLSGYDMDSLTSDTKSLIEELVDGPVHFLGLSMGGFIGMRLAIHHPEMLKSLMLLETTADPEPEQNKPKYRKLAFIAKWLGVGLIAEKTMAIMFSQSFLNDPDKVAIRLEWKNRLKKLNRWKFGRAVQGVVERDGVYDQLDKIALPTLIVVGDEDVATVPAKAKRMHSAIKDSKLVTVTKAGHTSSIEQPEQVTKAITDFLG